MPIYRREIGQANGTWLSLFEAVETLAQRSSVISARFPNRRPGKSIFLPIPADPVYKRACSQGRCQTRGCVRQDNDGVHEPTNIASVVNAISRRRSLNAPIREFGRDLSHLAADAAVTVLSASFRTATAVEAEVGPSLDDLAHA